MPGGQVIGTGTMYVSYNGDWYAKSCVVAPPPLPYKTWEEIGTGGKTWTDVGAITWQEIEDTGVTP